MRLRARTPQHEKPLQGWCPTTREAPLLIATRKSLHTATKTQHRQYINRYILKKGVTLKPHFTNLAISEDQKVNSMGHPEKDPTCTYRQAGTAG